MESNDTSQLIFASVTTIPAKDAEPLQVHYDASVNFMSTDTLSTRGVCCLSPYCSFLWFIKEPDQKASSWKVVFFFTQSPR